MEQAEQETTGHAVPARTTPRSSARRQPPSAKTLTAFKTDPGLNFDPRSIRAGSRLGIAVSGGADSVALLRLAHGLAASQGWRLRVLHVQHGLRGTEAEADATFVESLAATLGIPCDLIRVDTAAAAAERGLGLEEAGRLARYTWWKRLLLAGELDAVATGHTLDDQAETVLAKLLRGAWTAGLAGIYPQLPAQDLPALDLPPLDLPAVAGETQAARTAPGVIVRPLLGARRAALRHWLQQQQQEWREDATNAELRFTRNRIRHTVMPALFEVNPHASEHLAQLSVLARDEESYWERETARIMAGLVLPGRPVRGGGRANSSLSSEKSLGMEVERLRAMPVALQRRILRATANELGARLGFDETERLLALVEGSAGSTARREQLTGTLRAERTARELRFVLVADHPTSESPVEIAIPGEGEGFGVRVRLGWSRAGLQAETALLRAARPADRVKLRHSSGGAKRVNEVLERMGVAAMDRAGWPVVEWGSQVVWMRGAALEPSDVLVTLVDT